jgi:hypothetical protein
MTAKILEMKIRSGKILLHITLMGGITALVVLCILYPFLPGEYDSLAAGLSTMAQVFGVLGLLLLPIGTLWLVHELKLRARRIRNLPAKARRYSFALVSIVASSLVAVAVSLVAFATTGLSVSVLALSLWAFIVSRFISSLKGLKKTVAVGFNPTPLYLMFIPVAVTLFQLALASPATDYSRSNAITNSAELIHDIEEYHTAHGRYPVSLLAVWKDYYPSVVGIEKYHYAPDGDTYNLFFEQPRFLLDNLGTREFVVYNRLDEHAMISHTSWILILSPEELDTAQGWYAVQDAPSPHWKYFWFDRSLFRID